MKKDGLEDLLMDVIVAKDSTQMRGKGNETFRNVLIGLHCSA